MIFQPYWKWILQVCFRLSNWTYGSNIWIPIQLKQPFVNCRRKRKWSRRTFEMWTSNRHMLCDVLPSKVQRDIGYNGEHRGHNCHKEVDWNLHFTPGQVCLGSGESFKIFYDHIKPNAIRTLWDINFVAFYKLKVQSILIFKIFENRGAIMGCSNPHPHCQVCLIFLMNDYKLQIPCKNRSRSGQVLSYQVIPKGRIWCKRSTLKVTKVLFS